MVIFTMGYSNFYAWCRGIPTPRPPYIMAGMVSKCGDIRKKKQKKGVITQMCLKYTLDNDKKVVYG